MNKSALLESLKSLSQKGFLPVTHSGPSGLTRSIREHLGAGGQSGALIHGYRVLSSRDLGGKMTLLASVPNWELSPVSSTQEMLEVFGYGTGTDRRLNVTVEFGQNNSQGLSLDLSEDAEMILTKSTNPLFPIVAKWETSKLAKKIEDKFSSAVTLELEFRQSGKLTFFKVIGVRFLPTPKAQNIVSLIRRGSLTIDHVIENRSGSTVEHGPLFRIARSDLHLLFPGGEFVSF